MNYFPVFEKREVETNRKDGYWIEPIVTDASSPHAHALPNIVGYGLAMGNINVYQNPNNAVINNSASTSHWEYQEVQSLASPVGMAQADLRGSGLKDIIICYKYGATMLNCDLNGGDIVWLENPGILKNPSSPDGKWTSHYIGRSVSMHRLRVGHFTRADRWQVVAMPIVHGRYDLVTPAPVVLFTQPEDFLTATKWSEEVIETHFFHIIHDAVVRKYPGNNSTGLDGLLIASSEGINWYYYDIVDHKWKIENIGKGEQEQRHQTGWYGSGCVDIGTVKGDTTAYIATVEPFHGNTIAVYVKSASDLITKTEWTRYILDVFGPPDHHGEGPAHFVICADFDNDGDQEFLVALRGPDATSGVYYYKAIDLARGVFAKWHVAQESAARIAVADFNGDGTLDFATIAYNVPGYFESPNPGINIYYNRFVNKAKDTASKNAVKITAVEGKHVTATIPRVTEFYQRIPILSIGGIDITLELIPAGSSRVVDSNTFVKVLNGSIYWTDSENNSQKRGFLVEPRTAKTLAITTTKDDFHFATKEGAVIFVYTNTNVEIPHFPTMDSVTVKNIFPVSSEGHSRVFKFVRVDSLDWGAKFAGLEFYNMDGISIDFVDGEHLVYTQFWTAGQGVNCGLHNHATDVFGEVHACIVNGTGHGGMEYLPTLDKPKDIEHVDESKLIVLPVPTFHEHGPLWTKTRPDREIYPYHKWQAGKSSKQTYDVWTAFEFNPKIISEHLSKMC